MKNVRLQELSLLKGFQLFIPFNKLCIYKVKMNFFFLVISILLIVTSCSKDDNAGPMTKYPDPSELFRIDNDDELYGFMNANGDTVIQQQYVKADFFYYDLACVKFTSGKFGYINRQGILVIPAIFDYAGDFTKDNLALVKVGLNYGFINKEGNYVVTPKYKSAKPFSEGLAAVKSVDKWGFIDTKGTITIPQEFAYTEEFSEGYCLVTETLGGNIGYIDKTGEVVIDYKYKNGKAFVNGLCPVQLNSLWGAIDKRDTMVIDNAYYGLGNLYEGLMWFCNDAGKFGYFDGQGNIKIQPTFDYAMDFSNGLAVTRQNMSDFGYIDKTGNKAFQATFQEAYDFKGSLALIMFSDFHMGYINKQGKTIWKSANEVQIQLQ